MTPVLTDSQPSSDPQARVEIVLRGLEGAVSAEDAGAAADLVRNMGRMVLALEQALAESARVDARRATSMASERSAAAIRDAFLSGRRSAVQITADCLARAMAAQRFNVFSRVLETEALAAARALDRRLAAGLAMPALAGVPFVAKNLFDLRGHPTLAGAAPRQADAPAARDAAVLRALLDAGAVPIGLTHMDEYACGATGEM